MEDAYKIMNDTFLEFVCRKENKEQPEKKNLKFVAKKVYFSGPATVILWEDGTKTVVRCQLDDQYDAEKGIAMCFMKKALGNNGNFNEELKRLVYGKDKNEEGPQYYIHKKQKI